MKSFRGYYPGYEDDRRHRRDYPPMRRRRFSQSPPPYSSGHEGYRQHRSRSRERYEHRSSYHYGNRFGYQNREYAQAPLPPHSHRNNYPPPHPPRNYPTDYRQAPQYQDRYAAPPPPPPHPHYMPHRNAMPSSYPAAPYNHFDSSAQVRYDR